MKKGVLLGFGLAAISTVSTYAGTMGAASTGSTYPAGFVIGGDVGYGYLSFSEWATSAPPAPASGTASLANGAFIWGLHGGYDIPVIERFLLGFEVGYKNLGRSSSTSSATYPKNYLGESNDLSLQNSSLKLSQQAIDILLTTRLYVLNGLNVFGKAGPAYVRSESNTHLSVNYPDGTNNGNGTKSEVNQSLAVNPVIWRLRPELAIGVGYSFKNNLDIHLMYTYINGSDFNEVASAITNGNTGNNNNVGSIIGNTFSGVAAYNAVTIGLSYYFG